MAETEERIVTKKAGQATELIIVAVILAFLAFAVTCYTRPSEATENARPNTPPAPSSKVTYRRMRVTAYCPCEKCCGQWSDGVTACGHRIREGDRFVAADKSVPFGTRVIVPGYAASQPVKVLDRGGAIYDNRLDVFFATHDEALEWGVKYLKVKIWMKTGQD